MINPPAHAAAPKVPESAPPIQSDVAVLVVEERVEVEKRLEVEERIAVLAASRGPGPGTMSEDDLAELYWMVLCCSMEMDGD